MVKDLEILIADDHFLFRNGLMNAILMHPRIANVSQCENGEEVLKLIETNHYHIIFMDIRMPLLNGIETAKKVRTINNEIKIIAISMLDDRASIVRMFQCGANGYLIKNTTKEELFEAIDTVVTGDIYIGKGIPGSILETVNYNEQESYNSVSIKLSKRESDILRLICQGYTNKEASEILSVTVKNIEGFKTRLMDKTGAKNSAGLVRYAYENNLIS